MKLTPEQIALAEVLHRNGASPWLIARQFHCTADTVRRVVDPEFRNRRNAQIRDARVQRVSRKGVPKYGSPPRPSPEMLADRDRRMSAKVTANMAVLGDPPPGRSALDRMGGRHAEP